MPLIDRHEHHWTPTGGFEHAPVSHGRHTQFIILMCGCGAVDVFPRMNYLLTTPEFQIDFLLALRARSHYLVDSPVL